MATAKWATTEQVLYLQQAARAQKHRWQAEGKHGDRRSWEQRLDNVLERAGAAAQRIVKSKIKGP